MRQVLTAAVCVVATAWPGAAAAAPGTVVERPTYGAGEQTVSSPYVVVHYTRSGRDRPRFMRDDNRNGVPNYIEKLAASANKAWRWYAHNGFKAPLPDSGGPDPRVDIYVKALPPGTFGITYPSTVARGGAFMVIDNGLDEAHLAKRGSLQQTTAHELFHLFQLSYVPSGHIPAWAAEGSALAMQTYVYPHIVDLAAFDYLDRWLSAPSRSLYDEGRGCDHCYGGALFWRFLFGLGDNVVSGYLGRLYGYERIHRPIRLGLQPLDEILRRNAHGSLYAAFGRFSYDIYRAGFTPSPLYHLTAGPAVRRSRPRIVVGLSTHYVPILVSRAARGIAVGVASAGGPNPEVKLVVGGPKGRVLDGVLRSRGHRQYFVTRFRSAAERSGIELIVTSGRQAGTAYEVATRAF